MTVCPVLESMRVVTGSQRQETVFAFSCLVITQCSITSAEAGGIWLRIGAGAGAAGWGAAAGFFLVAQPAKSRVQIKKTRIGQSLLIATGRRPLAQYNSA
jgi:hypothetical protein